MKIEFDTETNELKADGKVINKVKTNLQIDTNYLSKIDGDEEILGYFLDLNIKFYKPK